MRPLNPGERPPQFVLFSFDGAGADSHWKRVLPLAQRSNARFTGFLTGLYLVPNAERTRYTGPGHAPGKSSVGFGGSEADIAAIAQALAARPIVQMLRDLLRNMIRGMAGGGELRVAHPVIGKIDRRLGPAQRRDQAGAPALIKIGQRTVMLAQGLGQLGRGFGIHQIGDGLGPGEVQLAVLHRPAAEFSRFGGPERQRRQRREQGLAHRPAAMDMEFGGILAGEAGRAGQPEQQGAVDLAPGAGVSQPPQHRPAG